MKINSDLTKTLLGMAAKTALDTFANSGTTPSQNHPEHGVVVDPETTDMPAKGRQKNTANSQSQDSFTPLIRSIGTQVASSVTDGLSRKMDQKIADSVQAAELAIERQRKAALIEMQAVIEAERTNAMADLRKTAASISNKILVSAAFIGGSVLMAAAALFLHR